MDHEPEPRRYESSNATMVYMVSIYLLLIAFFVILHTVSKKEEVRTAAVVGSLRVTFQRPEGRTEDLPQDTGQPQFSGPNAEFTDKVIGLFGSFINSSRFSQTRRGNVLRIAVDPGDIFYAGTATPRSDRIGLMRGLADMITNPQPYQRNTIDIRLEREGRGGDGAGKTLEVRRAGVIARDLVANEVDPRQVTVGITQGGGNRIFMTFSANAAEEAGTDAAGGGDE